jgi:hypothetical protein
MTDVLSALIPPAVVAVAVVYAVVKLLRSEAAGWRTAGRNEKSHERDVS